MFFLFNTVVFAQNNILYIEIDNIKNAQGLMRINLFQTAKGFPGEYQQAAEFKTKAAIFNMMKIKWTGLARGEYAVSVVHDENENGKLDTNFFGIPSEGVGVSNNTFPTFSAPKFESAKFRVDSDSTHIIIKMKYY